MICNVNAPSLFSSMVWPMVVQVLPASVQKKVDFLSVAQLGKYIHPSQRPVEYGGTGVDLGQDPGHKEFLALEDRWNNTRARVAMQEVAKNPIVTSETTGVATNNSVGNTTVSTNSSGGVMGWFQKRFQTTPTAYLGEPNKYRFNHITGKWDFDFETLNSEGHTATSRVSNNSNEKTNSNSNNNSNNNNVSNNKSNSFSSKKEGETMLSEDSDEEIALNRNSGDSKKHNSNKLSTNTSKKIEYQHFRGWSQKQGGTRRRSAKLTQEQLEEHGMVLAIQAAHVAKSYQNLSGASGEAGLDFVRQQQQQLLSHSMGEGIDLKYGGDEINDKRNIIPSAIVQIKLKIKIEKLKIKLTIPNNLPS